MFADATEIGATTQGTTFADIIINNVNAIADGVMAGFAQFIHDPKALKEMVSTFCKAQIPKRFPDAVLLRRLQLQHLDDIWRFPLNMSVPNTCPLPWTVVEANIRSQSKNQEFEFGIMRTIDFVGRNYIRFVLPQIDTSKIHDTNDPNLYMSDADHIYLGAWHREPVPRMIQTVSFYPRPNTHKLFEYTGHDIFIHNILFGNAQKEMNDLMSGEDKFELCYDPYRVNGSALGLSSYKGIDAFKLYNFTPIGESKTATVSKLDAADPLGKDGIADYFQVDSTMDQDEFRNFYRAGVWFETPVAQNYNARHSIHERRMIHQRKILLIPLDILPFGYSIGSSLPSASLSCECGFLKVNLYENWLDRAFYLTRLSDIPSLHPLVNHLHYAVADLTPQQGAITDEDPRLNWVNERSLGRFNDPSFERDKASGDDSTTKYLTQEGNVFGTVDYSREGIIPTFYSFENNSTTYKTNENKYLAGAGKGKIVRGAEFGTKAVRTSTSATLNRNEILETDLLIHRLSQIDSEYYREVKEKISVKLLQVGYQSLPCVRELLSKLPNIYITCEWIDRTENMNITKVDINNDLYTQAIVLWFIPVDKNGIESLRMYPVHFMDHELPIIAGVKLTNEQSQGTIIYDWNMLNVFNPANMHLNPLIENIGLISFSPSLTANTFPLAYYDANVNGFLKIEFLQGEGETLLNTPINMKNGNYKIISIGVNGVANVNLNLFRLIF